jgi:ankyrin repeat protein
MATAALPQDPDLNQLRTRARELQRAVRAADPAALARLQRWHPAPPQPETLPLSAAQLVLARELGFASWTRLGRHVQIVTARSWRPDRPVPADEQPAEKFLRLACLDYQGAADPEAAQRLLAQHPGLGQSNLFVAAACADVEAVRRLLSADPNKASRTGGPHDWSPLLYQAYARHDPTIDRSATLTTATLLIQAGADPNDGRFWHGLPSPFTVLTGVLGHGERNEPEHPHAIAFARLLLEAGADPNDGQALYNRMFDSNDDHLVLLFDHGLGRDADGPWHRLLGEALDPPELMLRKLLHWAVLHDQRDRVALLAEHGVDVVSRFADQRHTPVELALLSGHRQLADQLRALGGRPARLDRRDGFVAAVLAGDVEAARQTPSEVVEAVRRQRTGLMTWAASQGGAKAVTLLAELGFDLNSLGRSDLPSNQPWQTALHVAAENDDLALAETLLRLGADPGIRDARFQGSALDWARYFDRPVLIELLEAQIQSTE